MNQASIFTLEKNAKGYKDFEEFPTDLYVDTSAWIHAYGSQNRKSILNQKTNRYSNDIVDFMKDCVDKGVVLYHSNLVLKEAIHIDQVAYLDSLIYDQNTGIRIPRFPDNRVNYKKLRDIIANEYPAIYEDIKKSREGLLMFIKNSSMNLSYDEDEEFLEDVTSVIDSTNGVIDTQDATHVCVARSYGINSFLTADADYIYLDNDNVFAISNEKYTGEKIGRANILLPFKEDQF